MNTNKTSLDHTDQDQRQLFQWLLAISVILIASNLRAPLTSVGSLITFIRDDLQLSHAVAGSITTLPLLAFAFLSPIVPKIANRLGMEWTISICLFFLTVGIGIRSLPSVTFLFAGTILIGLAISIGNVLLPAFIKMNFPLKIGLMTGLYAVSMNLFGALASGISVPVSMKGFGWQGALGLWGFLSLIALILWIPQLRKKRQTTNQVKPSAQKSKSMWRSPLAWQVTLFMGLQSYMFYTLVTWLPEIVQFNGYSSSAAGWMLSLLQFAIIPITFIIPIIAERMKSQSLLGAVTALLFLLGICGLLFGSASLIPVSVIVIGIGGGSAFGLAMMFFTLRTTDGKQAAELSGMAQSIGYLLAAVGPALFGGLLDITNSWQTSLAMLIVVSIVIFIVGIGAGRDRVVSEPAEEN